MRLGLLCIALCLGKSTFRVRRKAGVKGANSEPRYGTWKSILLYCVLDNFALSFYLTIYQSQGSERLRAWCALKLQFSARDPRCLDALLWDS